MCGHLIKTKNKPGEVMYCRSRKLVLSISVILGTAASAISAQQNVVIDSGAGDTVIPQLPTEPAYNNFVCF